MKHKFDIWTKNPHSRSKIGYISHHIEITENELEELALELFKRNYNTNDEYEYSAHLVETII